jgi:hypothetical protein
MQLEKSDCVTKSANHHILFPAALNPRLFGRDCKVCRLEISHTNTPTCLGRGFMEGFIFLGNGLFSCLAEKLRQTTETAHPA